MIDVFKLSNSAEINDIGYEFPQVDQDWNNLDYWGKESVISTPLSGIIGFNVIFPKFTLKRYAKLTDLLSANNIVRYLMVSEKLFQIINRHAIDDYQYFVEKVHTPQGAIDYYLIYLTTPRDDGFFDWQHCLFYDVNDPEKNNFSVADSKAYYAARNGKILKPERIVIKPGQPAFDLFRCLYFDGGTRFFISCRLKEALEAAGITGIRLDPMPCFEAGEGWPV